MANSEYAHGGISLQECVIPELIVERGEEAVTATITEISWRGMRCRVAVKSNADGLQVDLRLNWKQAASSIVAASKNWEATAKRASLSRTTNTRAPPPRSLSPTLRDGCSIPSRQPSETTHEH